MARPDMKSDLESVRGIRPITGAEKAVLDEFCREMREDVIPQVSDEILEREFLAIQSRARLL